MGSDRLLDVYRRLLGRYGPRHWWPGDSPFEVMVGAVLTQATAWSNVEKAIASLKAADAMSPAALRQMPMQELAKTIRSSRFYNSKARKLKALAQYLGDRFGDDLDAMALEETATLREELLGVYGIGEETADDILLYALGKPVFVVDAYTTRLLSRLGLADEDEDYATYQDLFTARLRPDADLYGEFHALIVAHGARVCKKSPLCRGCCLLDVCPTGQRNAGRAGGPPAERSP